MLDYVNGTRSADTIRASGRRAALTGRTDDRTDRSASEANFTLAERGPSTDDNAARGVERYHAVALALARGPIAQKGALLKYWKRSTISLC